MDRSAPFAIPAIEIRSVDKWFGNTHALDALSLEILEGEFFSLLGPSGCGKSTLLRIMAGQEAPDQGQVLLRGEDVTKVPPNKRNVNLVFQSYELFPHMNVFDNVAYGLKLKKVPKAEIRLRVTEMLGIVRVAGLEKRFSRELSGGQQQRVALARALVNRPAVLLLDEPMSALDVKLRKQMQFELKAIQHRLRTTFVYVTHDQEEALLMSDRVAVMNSGRILQIGSPREIYSRPAAEFVADFVGSLNILNVQVDTVEGGAAVARVGDNERILVRVDPTVRPGDVLHLAIRPERMSVRDKAETNDPSESWLEAEVVSADYAGPITHYRVRTGSMGEFLVDSANVGNAADRSIGERVAISWAVDAAFTLPGDG